MTLPSVMQLRSLNEFTGKSIHAPNFQYNLFIPRLKCVVLWAQRCRRCFQEIASVWLRGKRTGRLLSQVWRRRWGRMQSNICWSPPYPQLMEGGSEVVPWYCGTLMPSVESVWAAARGSKQWSEYTDNNPITFHSGSERNQQWQKPNVTSSHFKTVPEMHPHTNTQHDFLLLLTQSLKVPIMYPTLWPSVLVPSLMSQSFIISPHTTWS